jgi:hypothetical protein
MQRCKYVKIPGIHESNERNMKTYDSVFDSETGKMSDKWTGILKFSYEIKEEGKKGKWIKEPKRAMCAGNERTCKRHQR